MLDCQGVKKTKEHLLEIELQSQEDMNPYYLSILKSK